MFDLDDISKNFLVLSLIICCVVVFLARDLTTACIIIAMIASVALIYTSGTADSASGQQTESASTGIPIVDRALELVGLTNEKSGGPSLLSAEPAALSTDLPAEPMPVLPPADMYGPYYAAWHQNRAAYTDCYPGPRAPAVAMLTDDVDSSIAMITIDRGTRDKKCIDGWVARDANYYKHHFGDEFEQAEARPWWGRHEF